MSNDEQQAEFNQLIADAQGEQTIYITQEVERVSTLPLSALRYLLDMPEASAEELQEAINGYFDGEKATVKFEDFLSGARSPSMST